MDYSTLFLNIVVMDSPYLYSSIVVMDYLTLLLRIILMDFHISIQVYDELDIYSLFSFVTILNRTMIYSIVL